MMSFRSLSRSAIVAAVVLATSSAAQAQTSFTAFLNGPAAGVGTSATGNGTVLMNAERTQITISLVFQGLSTPFTVAHIHNGAVGVGGPVLINIGSLITPQGGTSGSIPIMNAVLNINMAQANVLLAGNGYFNIHTSAFPNGEIRGQINVVPEPSTYLLMATGLGGVMMLVRRRRAS